MASRSARNVAVGVAKLPTVGAGPDASLAREDHVSADDPWHRLLPGTPLTLVKLAPDGSEVTRYPGVVVETGAPAPWLAVRSIWVNRRIVLDGLALETGDTLVEYFSSAHPFNAFAVLAPNGTLRGWYANVTHPATLDPGTAPPTLVWHDLFVDLVLLRDGTVVVRDEDELAEAALIDREPALHAAILAARDDLLARAAARAIPFHFHDDAPNGQQPSAPSNPTD